MSAHCAKSRMGFSAILSLLVSILLLLHMGTLPAEIRVERLYNFAAGQEGYFPDSALVQGADGAYYGTTSAGGQYGNGVVYRLDEQGHYTNVHDFNGDTEGVWASELTAGPDGSLFGQIRDIAKTRVYKIDRNGRFSILAEFATFQYGSFDRPALTLGADGALYGILQPDEMALNKAVFRLTPSGKLTLLHEFDETEWAASVPLAVGTDGSVHGTTLETVYKIDRAGQYKRLYRADPQQMWLTGELQIGANGSLYGIARSSRMSEYTNLFLYKLDSKGQFSVVQKLMGNEARILKVAGDGILHGVLYDPNNRPLIFQVSPQRELTFGPSIRPEDFMEPRPVDAVSLDTEGNICVVAWNELFGPPGRAKKIDAQGKITELHQFQATNGHGANVVNVMSDGSVYGTYSAGGRHQLGTFYRLDKRGKLRVLHHFADGEINSALTMTSAGTFVGLGVRGVKNIGTLYQLDRRGNYRVMHRYGQEAGLVHSLSPLIEGADGSFYAITAWDLSLPNGAVFRFDRDGTVNRVVEFNGRNGATPAMELTRGLHGNMFGTTQAGGRYDYGTVFRIKSDGTHTVLHHFKGSDGGAPLGGLMLAPDGSLLGSTSVGGPKATLDRGRYVSGGTVFRLDPKRKLSTRYAFDGSLISNYGGKSLLSAPDGSLYGITSLGNGIYRLDPSGRYHELPPVSSRPFSSGPYVDSVDSRLIWGPDGSIYGIVNPAISNAGNTELFKITNDDLDFDGIPNSQDNCLWRPNADQLDSDGDSYGNVCDADFDNSGKVTAKDLVAFMLRFPSANPEADLTGDGKVDRADLVRFKLLLKQKPGPSGVRGEKAIDMKARVAAR